MALASPKPYVNSPGANLAAASRYGAAVQNLLYPSAPASNNTAPVSAPAAPPARSVDYQALLRDDPFLQQTLAGVNASGIANQAALRAAQARALAQYGGTLDPAALATAGVNGIDETTRNLAAQNTRAGLSTVARLQNAYRQAQQGSDADLAARGLLRSGAYGQHAAENLLGYNQSQSAATQDLLEYLQGIYNGFLSQQSGLQTSVSDATRDALGRLITQISAGLISGGTPAPPPSTPAASPLPPATPQVSAPTPTTPAAVNPAVPDPYRAALAYAAATRRPVAA